jgi:CSLREA domain-containing protein
MTCRRWRRGWVVSCVLAVAGAAASSASATTYVVTKVGDTNDGVCSARDCSVREAVTAAIAAGPGNTVSIPARRRPFVLTVGDLDLTADIRIDGAGAGKTILDGNHATRLFEVYFGATATITHVTIRNGQGGVSTAFPGHVHGGGIHNHGTLVLTESTLVDNRAPTGGGLTNAATGTATLVNDTITRNVADSGAGGGVENLGIMSITNTTFSVNSASGAGGAVASYNTLSVKNVIFGYEATGGNCAGTAPTSQGHNLDTNNSCALTGVGDLVNTDPLLGNFLRWRWFPLRTGSPAIDAGDNTGCPATDERGVTRPRDGNGDAVAVCDMGSFERSEP